VGPSQGEQRGDDERADHGGEGGHRHGSVDLTGQRVRLGPGVGQDVGQPHGVCHQPPARGRQLRRTLAAAPRAVQQHQAGLPFERGDVLRNPRWREVQPPTGGHHAAGLGHGQ